MSAVVMAEKMDRPEAALAALLQAEAPSTK